MSILTMSSDYLKYFTLDKDNLSLHGQAQPLSALSMIAILILNVPASSVPVERVFSLCGNVCTDTRTKMTPDLLSALVRAKFKNYNKNQQLDCN